MCESIKDWFARLMGARTAIERAVGEIADLPPMLDNYRGVVRNLKSLKPELEAALADGTMDPGEKARIMGRFNDLLGSFSIVDKEVTEAIDATTAAARKIMERQTRGR